MNHINTEIKEMLRGDLADFIIFYVFKKYLTMFPSADIPIIADAIATNWAENLSKYNAEAFEDDEDDFHADDIKKEVNDLLQSEIHKTAKIVYNIAEDAYSERIYIEQLYASPEPFPKDKQK